MFGALCLKQSFSQEASVVTDVEIGKYLAYIRDKARLKQNELAEKVGWSAPVLSRVESGERPLSNQELNAIVEAIGTKEAVSLKESIGRNWKNLPKPPLGHPDEALLWKAETTLQDIDELMENQDIRASFARRLEASTSEIQDASYLVLKTEHNIAFIGNIGVGKSTTICRVTGLEVQNNSATFPASMLEVGGGGITICEVHLAQGPQFGILVEPRSEEEIRREVLEFATLIKSPPEQPVEDNSETHDSYGTSKEIERAIRNMSGLRKRRVQVGVRADGRIRRKTEDDAKDLADKSSDTNAFALEILARMELSKRTRRELWYPDISGKDPLLWLQETFKQVNNGSHPEFSIPNRIEVIVPQRILNEETLSIRLIDTKGIDRTAVREDLERHINDLNTIVVLCSAFNDAPSTSVQEILKRALESQVSNLKAKTTILALPRPDEAMAMKDDQGDSAETVEDGYDLKRDQVDMSLLATLSVSDVSVEFFNAREDDPKDLERFLLDMVNELRQNHCNRLSEMIQGANAQVQNFQEQQVLEVQAQAARRIMTWIQNNKELDSSFSSLEMSLIRAINSAHPSSLRASVRRKGDWYNLEYSPQLGFGARRMALIAIGPLQEKFNAITENLTQDPELKEAVELVQQTQRIMDSGIESLLEKCRLLGRTIHTRDMKSDIQPWDKSNNEWGRGYGYRDRVSDHHQNWFDNDVHRSQSRVEELIIVEWRQVLDRMASILDTDAD